MHKKIGLFPVPGPEPAGHMTNETLFSAGASGAAEPIILKEFLMSLMPSTQPSVPADTAFEIQRLCDQVRPEFLQLFQADPVQQLWYLQYAIPVDLARARCQLQAEGDQLSAEEQSLRGRTLLSAELIDRFVAEGSCTRHVVIGEEEIHFVRPAETAPPGPQAATLNEAPPAKISISPADTEVVQDTQQTGPKTPVDATSTVKVKASARKAKTMAAAARVTRATAESAVTARAGPGDWSATESPPELPFHELADLFPLMIGAEFDKLIEDIRVNGLDQPIWLYQGKVLDGRNRYRACRALGIQPPTREFDGSWSPLTFVLTKNLHRRHLSPSQLALVAAKIKPLFEDEAHQRMLCGRAPDPQANLPEGQSRDQAAAAVGVSPRLVESGSKVLKKGSPVLIDAVAAGELSATTAAHLADLPAEEQAEAVHAGKKAAQTKTQAIRQQKGQECQQRGQGRRKPAAEDAPERPGPSAESAKPLTPPGPSGPDQAESTDVVLHLTSPLSGQSLLDALQAMVGPELAAQIVAEAFVILPKEPPREERSPTAKRKKSK
jgi:ParB-like chromosome segregation protein Spo0J